MAKAGDEQGCMRNIAQVKDLLGIKRTGERRPFLGRLERVVDMYGLGHELP
jgi:hypothetical protein